MDFSNLFLGLCKLAILMIFVTAIIEVIKGISAKGLWHLVSQIVGAIFFNKRLSDEALHTLNFVVGLIGLKLLNFTLLASLLSIDLDKLGPGARWFDYIASAAVVYMGADWVFQQFVKLRATAQTVEKKTTEEVSNVKST